MARNLIIGRRNWVSEGTLSGGDWNTLSNIQEINPQIATAANGTATADTKFRVDFGVNRTVGVVFFANLLTRTVCTLRVWASINGVTPVWDTGTVSAWPIDSTPGGLNPWGVTTPTGAYNAEFYEALGFPRFFVPTTPFVARYIDVELADTGSPDPIRIGKFGACEIWESPINFEFGWKLSVLDESEILVVPGGSMFPRLRNVRRRLSFGVGGINESEFLARQLDLTMVMGQHNPFPVVPFPDAGGDLEKLAMYGRFSAAPEFTNPFFGLYAQTFQIDQMV